VPFGAQIMAYHMIYSNIFSPRFSLATGERNESLAVLGCERHSKAPQNGSTDPPLHYATVSSVVTFDF
jgi:hypothetical protein